MTTTKTLNYRELQTELDELITGLQSGTLTIDEAIKAYERGQVIIKQLDSYLKQAENKVKKLSSIE